MADDDPNRLKGSSCTASLDYGARTLTFEHRGMFRPKPQKASPVIVPFDEITSVEYDWGFHHDDDTFSVKAMKKEMSSFPALQQAAVRYRCYGEKTYGMLERSKSTRQDHQGLAPLSEL
jgi:hypothetical protein